LKKPTEDVHKITSVYSVSVQGTIKMPMLEKEIPALGISVSTLTRRVEAAYIGAGIYYAPIFNVTQPGSVIVCRTPENVVTVGGEVSNSGECHWTKGMTLMEAIKKAGGFTEFAAINRVKLIRSNKETVYDLREIKPDGSNNPILLDGDQVIVPPG
jgi:protein involved in polysaccharide export with SLBB domain